jgi:hypothetical protein
MITIGSQKFAALSGPAGALQLLPVDATQPQFVLFADEAGGERAVCDEGDAVLLSSFAFLSAVNALAGEVVFGVHRPPPRELEAGPAEAVAAEVARDLATHLPSKAPMDVLRDSAVVCAAAERGRAREWATRVCPFPNVRFMFTDPSALQRSPTKRNANFWDYLLFLTLSVLSASATDIKPWLDEVWRLEKAGVASRADLLAQLERAVVGLMLAPNELLGTALDNPVFRAHSVFPKSGLPAAAVAAYFTGAVTNPSWPAAIRASFASLQTALGAWFSSVWRAPSLPPLEPGLMVALARAQQKLMAVYFVARQRAAYPRASHVFAFVPSEQLPAFRDLLVDALGTHTAGFTQYAADISGRTVSRCLRPASPFVVE